MFQIFSQFNALVAARNALRLGFVNFCCPFLTNVRICRQILVKTCQYWGGGGLSNDAVSSHYHTPMAVEQLLQTSLCMVAV
jgi:hypothetical protein